MMELKTCAFIVTLVSLVTASPYGYGVKGGAGAAARADSSAAAGTYGGRGDIPDVPFVNGFSGSFSKSTASSSSTSSASSSSSSSSFSYSGSGAGGVSSPGENGNAGCSFGNCENSGANQISGNHGSVGPGGSLHGYNGVSSGAVAGSYAAAGSGANCQGSTCNNNSGKCSSGQCSTNLLTDTSPTSHDSNIKCNSGQCGSSIETGPSASHYDSSGDIKFVAHDSKSDHGSKDLSSDYNKKPGYTGSDCRGGNCGPATTFNSPPTFSHGSPNANHNKKPTNYQGPADSNFGVTPGYNSPATHLEAPKQSSNCNSGSCNPGQSTPGYGNAPSSYNVPIHSSYDTNNQKPSCADGKCEYPQKGSYPSTTSNSLSTNYLTPQDLHSTKGPFINYPSSNCVGPSCSSGPSNTNPSGCSTPNCNLHNSYNAPNKTPGKITYPEPADKVTGASGPSHTGPSGTYNSKPTYGSAPTGCISPGCTGHISSPGANPLSTYNSVKPSASDENLPTYTGGFGGPPGMLKPNEFTIPASSKPIHSPSSTYNVPTTTTTGCKTPNCIGSSPGGVTTTQSGSYGIHKEGGGVSTTYTGSFGGPTGMLKPNEFDLKVTNKPIHSVTNQPSLPSASACKTPNCSPYAPVAGAISVANAQSGSYGATKPNAGADSSSELPPYTGSFGGPPGILKPSGYNSPHPSNNNPYPGPNKVTSNYGAGCTSPNCSPSIAAPSNPHSLFGAPQPSSPSSSITFPGYTSNYRPIGVTNPSAPAVAPISTGYTHPLHPIGHPPGTYSSGCKTGNCGAYTPTGPGVNVPSANPSAPSGPSASYGNSAECKTGNCGAYRPTGPSVNVPSANPSAPSKPTASYGNSAECKTGNCGAYTPTGPDVIVPSAYPSAPSEPSAPYDNSAECKTGNCGAYTPTGPDVNVPSANPSAPSKPSASYGHSAECKTGNCGAYTPTGPEVNVPSANPSAPSKPSASYGHSAECKTGNCGAYTPTGPDVNVPSANPSAPSKPSASYGHSAECKTGNCGAYTPTGPNVNVPPAKPSAPSKPSASYGNSAECKTGNCGAYSPTGPGVNPPSAHPQTPFKPSGSYDNSVECKTGNCGAYSPTGPDVNVPSANPNIAPKPSYGGSIGCKNGNCGASPSSGGDVNGPYGSYGNSGECKTGNCGAYPTSGSDTPTGSYGVTKPNTAIKPSNPLYTGNFGGPSGIVKPNDNTLNTPSGGCKTPSCTNQASATTEAAAQSGSYAGSKPQLPVYTGGFGAPSGLLKPNEYSNPSGSPTLNKPSSSVSPAVTCTSANCSPKGPSSSGHDVALHGAHALASSSANANAVIYSGGFGGPPGFLEPYDNGKVDLTKLVSGQNQGSHYGGANINFPHDSKSGIHGSGTTLDTGVAGPTNTGAVGGSAGGATAYSGLAAGANSGSYGYNTHGAHQAGNGGCGGGCGSGYQGRGSSASAGAKSLSSAGAYGGSFASSSASAHASAGAYTKGGYGKR